MRDGEGERAPRRVALEEERGERCGRRAVATAVGSSKPPSGRCACAHPRRAAASPPSASPASAVGSTSDAPPRLGGKPPSGRRSQRSHADDQCGVGAHHRNVPVHRLSIG